MTARYFDFEADFVATQRCIPMCVRHKLDLSGVKLKLNEWSKLDPMLRGRLANIPVGTEDEAAAYAAYLAGIVAEACGAEPSRMEPVTRDWDTAEVPAQVSEKAGSLGVSISPALWNGLDTLERFALMKLSRPGHEGKNFVPALQEFGITK